MGMIEVIAKVTGTHAASNLTLVEGETYEIDEEHFGDQVFERKTKLTRKPGPQSQGSQSEPTEV